MKRFLDTARAVEIRTMWEIGSRDSVTTIPKLVAKEGRALGV